MKAYIPCVDGIPFDINFYNAWLGFKAMGVETVPYFNSHEIDAVTREDIVVGGIGACQYVLKQFHITVPHINYPEALQPYMGRGVWNSTIGKVNCDVESWPVFVKSVEDKQFTGVVVRSANDLSGFGIDGDDTPVLCSEPVHFIAEWRCFVRYGEVLDLRPYKGDWNVAPNFKTIQSAIDAYTDAPAGYGIDFGLTEDGKTLLVEVNDGYGLGCYGLHHALYAQLLSARWSELMGVDDPFGYIGKHRL